MNILNRSIRSPVCVFLRYQSLKNYGTPANQIAKAMKKLSVIGKSNKKKGWHDTYAPVSVLPTGSVSNKRELSKQGRRRINVLNKLFMRYITDLMATGEISEELLGKGIQISGVKVTPDFHMVNVLWVANGTESDLEIEKALNKTAGAIKHELSELRVMGVVPYISFVKDKKLALVNEVEQLLKIAEYPEDYTPTEVTERLKEEFELHNSLPKELVKQIQALDNDYIDEIEESPMPEMQHNVFGLQQDDMMKKIGKEKDKVRAAWEQYEVRHTSSRMGEMSADQLKLQQESEEEVRERFKKYLDSKEFNRKDRRRMKTRVLDPYEDGLVQEVDEAIYFQDGDYLELEEEKDLSKQ